MGYIYQWKSQSGFIEFVNSLLELEVISHIGEE